MPITAQKETRIHAPAITKRDVPSDLSESQAWLVMTSDTQEPLVVAMELTGAHHWSASADVMPGEYRCRYYGGDDRRVIYYGAAKIAGSIEHGMDALLSIAAAECVQ